MAHSRFKRGTIYAFAPSGANSRDNLTAIGVRDQLATDLPMGPDLHKWPALWNAPEL